VAIGHPGSDAYLAHFCELDGIADEVQQHLRQPLLVTKA
jgi:hypothetical protein